MTRPWETLARVRTARGELSLRRRGPRDWLIALGPRVIMTSAAHRSESLLAMVACDALGPRRRPRVLIAGLGLGFTLRAALDALAPGARVEVAELEPAVVDWCRGPLAEVTRHALEDPRVRVRVEDVAQPLTRAAAGSARFDAVVLDLFEGPGGDEDPIFGRAGLARIAAALADDGVLAVWSERADARFERRLRLAGFAWERVRSSGGGLRHVVYLARAAGLRAGRVRAAGGARP
jgi:spermidine synthase